MKSEHRRELHANELERVTESIGKFFEKHGSKVLLGLLAAVAIGIGVWWFLSNRGKGLAQGTRQLVTATTAENYQIVAEMPEISGTKLAPIARLRAAELQLRDAIARYFTALKPGRDDLKDVQKQFDEVLQSGKLPNWARERALYGRAVAVEAMWDGKSDAPMKAYQNLLKEFPDTSYKPLVEERLKALKDPQTEQFYAYFASTERKSGDIGTPSDFGGGRGLPPNHPPITMPERPVELPRIPDTLNIDEDAAKPFPKDAGNKKGPAFPSDAKKNSGPDPKPPAKSTPKSKSPPAPKPEPQSKSK
jgi:hypothetical protein